MSYLEDKARIIRERGARDRAARGNARFWDEMRAIPVPARALAVLTYFGLAALLFYLMYQANPSGWEKWNDVQRICFAIIIPIFAAIWVLLIGYVNGDARRRGMRYIMWTFLAIFIPNAIGIILYFLMRDPLPFPCPSCGKEAGGSFAFCPHCGANLAPACPNCKRAVERSWANCAHCGTKLGGGEQGATS
ncbi:MAG TPA: zinc ribbon domain-containing protein [Candidatus Acidoferrales bacterium]|jgi:hypothetical protein|nr:zinc ribbon domain-containing protein [Candidatus Acidoferrales bacterium]